jgi:sialate O-acetylesterase
MDRNDNIFTSTMLAFTHGCWACLAVACCLALLEISITAEVRLADIFSDHMVLQQGTEVPIWGSAEPGEEVVVSLQGQRLTTAAGPDGRWQVHLKPLKAGGPFRLEAAGRNSIRLEDVLIGEVWLGSGQSNMVWPVNRSKNAKIEIARAAHPRIRLAPNPCVYDWEGNCRFVKTSWVECRPETARDFPATLYYFGRELHENLNIPVGLIARAVGGTPTMDWIGMSAETLPEATTVFELWRRHGEKSRKWGRHFDGLIAPVIPFALRGVVWDQGESGTGIWGLKLDEVRRLLVLSWRREWGQGYFPFLFVQYPKGGGWNRQGTLPKPPEEYPQDEVAMHSLEYFAKTLSLPETAMAPTFDLEGGTHPLDKQSYGKRLALKALAHVYGKRVTHSGPTYESMNAEGTRLRLHFKHADGGLTAAGGGLQGFAIAGEDRRFVWAEAVIDGNTVLAWSPKIPRPMHVRYGWAYHPRWCNLFNGKGFAALPFRTDGW